MRFQTLSELVGSIYDTVVDPSACPTMLNGLADLLGATGGAQVGAYNAKTHSATMLAPRLDPKELPSFSNIGPTFGGVAASIRSAPLSSRKYTFLTRIGVTPDL